MIEIYLIPMHLLFSRFGWTTLRGSAGELTLSARSRQLEDRTELAAVALRTRERVRANARTIRVSRPRRDLSDGRDPRRASERQLGDDSENESNDIEDGVETRNDSRTQKIYLKRRTFFI